MLRDIALLVLALIFVIVVVTTGIGLLFHTVQNVGLAILLFVPSYFLVPGVFGKACSSEGEVFGFGTYLKYLAGWTAMLVFCVFIVCLVVVLSAI